MPTSRHVKPDKSVLQIADPSALFYISPRRSDRSAEGVAQLPARTDAQLGEHLVQMPFHRAGADEQLLADLRVGHAVAGQAGDLRLLGCEIVPAVGLAG